MLFVSRHRCVDDYIALDRSFNLGIEMLFVSSEDTEVSGGVAMHNVSISESRCFSFQGTAVSVAFVASKIMFQSRNRDAFRFKFRFPFTTPIYVFIVSISESRCFSFQESTRRVSVPFIASFNLGIEMLFVSSRRIKPSQGLAIVSISESRCFSFQV